MQQQEFLRRAWAEINLDSLCKNVRSIREHIGEGKQLMAVVKANAYGHGDEAIATELQALGVSWFAVSNISEAIRLRKYGIKGEILILGITPVEKASALRYYNITQAAVCYEYAVALSEAAVEQKQPVRVHIKLDTGMGRIGLVCGSDGAAAQQAVEICKLEGLRVEGIFTHFAAADSEEEGDVAYTHAQQHKLETVAAALQEAMPEGALLVHSMNSAGALYYTGEHSDLVRAGIILYGHHPNAELALPFALSPIMSLKAVVSMVKHLPKGSCVSYGRTYQCERDMTVATIPIGYADGYPRALSSKAELLICGKRCKVLGRVCMDQLVVDCTDVPGVQAGDIATVFGGEGADAVTLDELAAACGTINYELTCGISMRVPRVFLKGGEIVGVVEYI